MKKLNLSPEELNLIIALREKNSDKAQGSAANAGAASVRGNEDVNIRSHRRDPMLNVITQGRKKYNALPEDLKSPATMASCLAASVKFHEAEVGGEAAFYAWMQQQAALVKRTFDFTGVCKQKGLNGAEDAIAENLVFAGKAVCNRVRLEGLAAYDGDIAMLCGRLVPEQYRFDRTANMSGSTNTEPAHE